MTTGRNFDEVPSRDRFAAVDGKHRVDDARQLEPGEDLIIAGSVSDQEAKKRSPQGWKVQKPYLRIVPQPQ